jgi:hypothetical protein
MERHAHVDDYERQPAEGNFHDEHRKVKRNLSLLKTTISAWAMSTKVTEWLIAIQFVREH